MKATHHPKSEGTIIGKRKDEPSVSGSYIIDLDAPEILWNITMTAAADFTFANLPTGTNTKRFSVRLTGNFAFTFPAYCHLLSSDTYDGTIKNRLEFEVIIGDSGSEEIDYRIENV